MPKYEKVGVKQMYNGCFAEGYFLLTAANVKTSANGSLFLACKLGDKDGEIDGKIWDYADTIHEHVGGVVKIRGSVSEYNGANQIVIDRIRLAQDGDPYDLKELVPCAPIDVDAALLAIGNMLNSITDDTYRRVALCAMERMKDVIKTIPAAKSVHHAFISGLLMHVYNMMQMSEAIGKIYGGDLIDMDLLLTGTFCHDMAKRNEFLRSEIGLVTDYTVRGKLLGHLTMGAQEIAEIGREIGEPADSEKIMLLQHMLLSHHGEPEFGAAVRPQIIEAEILSRVDMLDARIEMYREALNDIEMGTTSDFLKVMGHSIYNHF
jgi:3'-5' exoribonuclease